MDAMGSGQDDLLDTMEVSGRLRRSPETLRYWRHIGQGPKSFKLGRRVVYERSAVEAWIASQRAASLRGDAA